MLKNITSALVLAPHTDDGEFGCGGTIAKLAEMRKEVYYAAFSSCEKSLANNDPPDTLKKELFCATKKLGIPVFAIVDTNSNPNEVEYVIPANDDATKSISLIVGTVSKAIKEGLEERKAEKEKEGGEKEKRGAKKEPKAKVEKQEKENKEEKK